MVFIYAYLLSNEFTLNWLFFLFLCKVCIFVQYNIVNFDLAYQDIISPYIHICKRCHFHQEKNSVSIYAFVLFLCMFTLYANGISLMSIE